MHNQILGIDIGGTGIKGAIVDTETGELLTERLKIPTPKPATPYAVGETVAELVNTLGYKGRYIGCGFPAIVQNGLALTAANIDSSWVGVNIESVIEESTGCEVKAVNDADAAGMAEVCFGKGKGVKGTVLLITIGTGLGSAMFTDGHLVRNTELGHFYLKGHQEVVEKYASNSARKRDNLSMRAWAGRFNEYLERVERLFAPQLIILGGGISKKYDFFADYLVSRAEICPARYHNKAGVIGAAMFMDQFKEAPLV